MFAAPGEKVDVLNVINVPVNQHVDVTASPQTPAPSRSQVEALPDKKEEYSIVREYVKKFNHKQRRPNRHTLKRKRERDKCYHAPSTTSRVR